MSLLAYCAAVHRELRLAIPEAYSVDVYWLPSKRDPRVICVRVDYHERRIEF